ncbi:MAG TPA: MMPL family transporter [Kofleriaceae bacterium]|nr:MMPL family transporter [Kofleriaceae bacterium]
MTDAPPGLSPSTSGGGDLEPAAVRYTAWLGRHARQIVALGVLVLGVAIYLVATRLPIRADLSYLLPEDAPAVRDLRKLSERLVARDTALVIVVAPDPKTRAAAAGELAAGARELHGLVERVEDDDAEARAFLRDHRHLLVPLPQLEAARDALARTIQKQKLAKNPLYIDLDEDPDANAKAKRTLDDLRAQRRDAEARLARSSYVSADGKTGLVVVRTAFSTTDAGSGKRLLHELDRVRARVVAAHPGVEIGFTGGVTTTVAEHDALIEGVVWSSLITGVLVALLLLAYIRSVRLVLLIAGNLVVATTAAFAIAVFTVGHLNAATAFLGAIIAGNGVNYGILLVARYREERGRADVTHALAVAIARTLRPTLVASLGAAIAYGSLAATSFRGFADFAIVGAVGMALCWIASYTLLPAAMLLFAPSARAARVTDAKLGRALARLLGHVRPGTVLVAAGIVGAVALAIAARYIASDPFEYNLQKLRSTGPEAAEARRWIRISDATFGKSISGRIIFAADRRDQVPYIVEALRAIDANLPPQDRVVGGVSSILDVVPEDQPQRIAVLGQIRRLMDDPAIAALDDRERAELEELRPPATIKPITDADLPRQIRDPLVERSGRVGNLVSVRPGPKLDQWNGHDLLRLAAAVRSLQLRDGETISTSGSSVIFADIVTAIESDGPRVTALAAFGIVIMVVLLAGRDRRAVAVLCATVLGTLVMVAVCALIGIKVNFLDFVALPITLGLGVDYAINVADRAHRGNDPAQVLRTTGGAVAICSLTTIIGYGSLLLSQNGAIRGFGLASLIGEVACVVTALALVPAIAFVGRERERH